MLFLALPNCVKQKIALHVTLKIIHIMRNPKREMNKPVAEAGMKINNQLFFGISEEASLQVRAEIVSPAKTTTLAAAAESGKLRNSTPTALAISENEVDEFFIFLSRPRPFLHPKLVTARLSSHH